MPTCRRPLINSVLFRNGTLDVLRTSNEASNFLNVLLMKWLRRVARAPYDCVVIWFEHGISIQGTKERYSCIYVQRPICDATLTILKPRHILAGSVLLQPITKTSQSPWIQSLRRRRDSDGSSVHGRWWRWRRRWRWCRRWQEQWRKVIERRFRLL